MAPPPPPSLHFTQRISTVSDLNGPITARRDFLTKVAAAATVVVAGGVYAAPLAAASAPSHRSHGAPAFDDTWTARVSAAKHRAVFDSPAMDDGLALEHALAYLTGYHEMFDTSDDDMGVVVVMRHMGTSMAMGDALWDKYEVGKSSKTKDPATGAEARRNPFITGTPGDKEGAVSPSATLAALRGRGVVLLACNRALMHFAATEAKKRKQDLEATKAEMRAGLAPGVILQPSGIYANMRAQEVGCGFIKST